MTMIATFFRWLDDPFFAMSFFLVAVAVCWWGARSLRMRRMRLQRATAPTARRPYQSQTQRERRHAPPRAALSALPGAKHLLAGEAAATALPLTAWWPQIVDSPITVMIVGESQSGKSTTARALLAERARTDQVVILDPHEKFNSWGGLQEAVIGRDRDLEAIVATVVKLQAEFERRFKRGETVERGLSIFIDEVPAIIAAAPEVSDYLAAWLLEGAKAQFRVVFLTQEPGVEALGLKGKGRVRLSTRKVLLGAYAAGVPGALAWPAAIEVRGGIASIDASALPAMAARAAAIDPAIAWRVPTEPARDSDDSDTF
ncbi:type IV secretory system conjugative DNA transfer family protein, partial [Oscillochloris sp. ZM17-4]|uniref:type IV secretory system conjugative DNA transfer family protein n=1 Tax=Oscillochloris sp. ZM17-4 TaxID=2866714 RepID=UPI001C72E8D0